MKRTDGGHRLGLFAVVTAFLMGAPVNGAPALSVVAEDGVELARVPLGGNGRWCLLWEHSVAGFRVQDCFRVEGERLVLEHSHQPDFAAGLGDIPGRGNVVSDGAGGYHILDMEVPLPREGLRLRRGGAEVNHRLLIDGEEHPLPGRQGMRLLIRPTREE